MREDTEETSLNVQCHAIFTKNVLYSKTEHKVSFNQLKGAYVLTAIYRRMF